MSPDKFHPVFVVGMHRSGTTMVTRALHEAGVFSGAVIDHNQEPLFAIAINEGLLIEAGGSWWQPPAQDELERVMQGWHDDLLAIELIRRFLDKPDWRPSRLPHMWPWHWAMKDPRLCLTLPWWIDRFPHARVLWVQRDPAAIIDSLLRRQTVDGEAHSTLTAETAAELVARYDEAAVRSIKRTGVPFLTVRYEDLTSADSAVQAAAWTSVYRYSAAEVGNISGFAPRSAKVGASDAASAPVASAAPTQVTDGPLVSVIVPNYNHAPYLDARIGSIVNQTYRNIEILLMDDCSPDDSRTVLEAWAAKDPRIELMFNEANSGSPFHQWQKGAAWAKGKYLWIAESDDVAELDMLATHVAALEANDRAVVAYSQSEIIDEQGNAVSSWNENYRVIFGSVLHWQNRFTVPGKDEVANRMVFSNTIPNASGVLFRKSAFDEAGVPETTWKLNGDWLFYARLLQLGDLEFFPEHRNKFRLHPQTQRMRSTKAMATYFEVLAMLRVFEQEKWAEPDMIDAARREVSGWWARSMFHAPPSLGNVKASVALYREFARYNPRLHRSIAKVVLTKAKRVVKRAIGRPLKPYGVEG